MYLTTKMVPEPDGAGKTQTVLAISRDVSDIKRTERQLKESRDLLQQYKGSGIGLAICRKIMQMHGGFITAASEPGKGARFSCYFPVL